MSVIYTKTFPEKDLTVEIFGRQYDQPNALKDLTMERLGPILVASFPGCEISPTHVQTVVLMARLGESNTVGGMLLEMKGDEWTGNTVVKTYQEAVHPDHRRKGVGSALFATLLEWSERKDNENQIEEIQSCVNLDEDFERYSAFMAKQGFKLFEELEKDAVFRWCNAMYYVPSDSDEAPPRAGEWC